MRILWVKTELLHPVDKGGRIRTYQMLKRLRALHEITYLTLDDGRSGSDAVERAEEYCHDLVRIPHESPETFSGRFYLDLLRNAPSRLPYAVWKYRSAALREAIERIVRRDAIDLVVCDFLAPSCNVPHDLDVPILLFEHNVEAMIWRRHHEVARNPMKRAFLRREWRRMQAFECRECRRYDRVVAVSEADRRLLADHCGADHIEVVPTGVDTMYFRPGGAVERAPGRIVFTGSMDWLPNVDAVRYFTGEILPRIRAAVPAVSFDVVGRRPTPEIRRIGERDEAVTVTGFVDDIRPYLERAAVAVVPLKIGGGTRLKIYEAMAMETPVVSTSVGAEGLPLRDGDDLLIADRPNEFARAVIRLLEDEAYARTLGERAALRVRREFGWDVVTRDFARICERTAGDEARVEVVSDAY